MSTPLRITATDGLLTAEHLVALTGDDLTTCRVLLYALPPMMYALTTQLVGRWVRRSRIISEEFALR